MFIYCMPKYMAWSFHYNTKRWKSLQICIPSLQKIMVYFIRKLNKKPIILTFGQFDYLVILDKLIWKCPTWLMVFLTNHKMVIWLIKSDKNLGSPKEINLKKVQFVNIKM